jgi:hypothetical protein
MFRDAQAFVIQQKNTYESLLINNHQFKKIKINRMKLKINPRYSTAQKENYPPLFIYSFI